MHLYPSESGGELPQTQQMGGVEHQSCYYRVVKPAWFLYQSIAVKLYSYRNLGTNQMETASFHTKIVPSSKSVIGNQSAVSAPNRMSEANERIHLMLQMTVILGRPYIWMIFNPEGDLSLNIESLRYAQHQTPRKQNTLSNQLSLIRFETSKYFQYMVYNSAEIISSRTSKYITYDGKLGLSPAAAFYA